jgi:hypothetical protein
MRSLLASTCLVALAAASTPLGAETIVDTKRTTDIRTSTAKNPGADDVRITSAGSIVAEAGVALRLDSNNKATNEGTIQISNADGSIGILASGGVTGTITNAASGKIILDETYTPTDGDNDGDLDGPFAAGSGRIGIATAGRFTGDVVNSGSITIEGKDSAGIRLGGPLTGRLTTDGMIQVVGDRSVGVRTGDVSGAVRIAGTIAAQGQGARAVAIEGNLAGALVVQGSLAATGYRSTTPPTDATKLDADDLLQGGSALSIAGSVAGGVILAVPPKDTSATDNDEDKDGIDDSKEGSAAVTSYGSAAAVQIGASDHAIAIGPVAGTGSGHGLIVDGTVSGQGVYSGVSGTGLQIGGLGGAVTIAGGLTVNGIVSASSPNAAATAIRIGAGATVPEIRNTGSINASGGGTAGVRTTAILIDAEVSAQAGGGAVFHIANSGTIRATASGNEGIAAAIVDRSGELDLIDNSGAISATGGKGGNNIAIDLSANTTGTTIGQTVVATGVTAPSITGDILLGSGNDILAVADGTVTGTTRFGAGANQLLISGDAIYVGNTQMGAGDDLVTMSGTSSFAGTADFGGGNDRLVLNSSARFSGGLVNAQGLAVTLASGTLDLGRTQASIRSLDVGAKGIIGVTLDPTAKTNLLYQVGGAASFADGAKLAIRLTDIASAEGRYAFLYAGSIAGAATLASNGALLPYMFKSSVAQTSANDLAIDISRKTAGELGLNRSQASAYNAIYAALAKDQKIAGVYLAATDGATFSRSLRQMLPDHAGGTFEAITMGSRATASFLADPNAPFADQGNWGYWIQQVGWGTAKKIGDTASYDITGWGASAGAEYKTGGFGYFGLSFAYLFGKDADGGTDNQVTADNFEGVAYWRATWGALSARARASYGFVSFDGRRSFTGTIGNETIERKARGTWRGRLVSLAGGIAYDARFGAFSLRPAAAVDYYRLRENGYAETGGGDAFDLIVDKRTSDELAVSGTVAAGLTFGGYDADSPWFRIEAEGGRRQLVGGSLGSTTARFAGGQSFTLDPEQRTSGWVGKLRASGGNTGFRISGEAGAEQQQSRAALSLRVSLAIGL